METKKITIKIKLKFIKNNFVLQKSPYQNPIHRRFETEPSFEPAGMEQD